MSKEEYQAKLEKLVKQEQEICKISNQLIIDFLYFCWSSNYNVISDECFLFNKIKQN